MKILILQLARLGDIYLTWPAIRALREEFPEAQIDIMVRHRFRHAMQGLEQMDRIWLLDTRAILRPILENTDDVQGSNLELDGLIQSVRAEKYNRIINLSFSPMSSYLTHAVTTDETEIRGYTRTSDGYLAIPDDGSAYFYAQVGIGSANRVHLSDLFAHICSVDLKPNHWLSPQNEESKYESFGDYITIHLGASQVEKTYGVDKWTAVIRKLSRNYQGLIALIGSADEKPLADKVLMNVGSDRLMNLVGETSLADLFDLVGHARLLIGCDSGPIHIASLVQTRCLNLSFETVNFWETGPRAPGSRVLCEPNPELLPSDRVSAEAMWMLNDETIGNSTFELTTNSIVSYQGATRTPPSFAWELTQALYMGGTLPAIQSETVLKACSKLFELNELAVQELQALKLRQGHAHTHDILDRVDEAMDALAGMIPEIKPVIRWYQTEKIRLGPMGLDSLVDATLDIHQKLEDFLVVFTSSAHSQLTEVNDDSKTAVG